MKTICLFLIVYLLSGYYASPITYDQRQNGDFNVQVDLKDIQIIALLKGSKEEYVDYDYAYDYSEMTIKPQNRTTPKPMNVTNSSTELIRDNVTTTVATGLSEQTTVLTPNKICTEIWNTTNNDTTTTVRSVVEADNVTEISTTSNKINTTSTTEPNASPKCKKGFVVNHKGECEFKLQGTGNALLKLVKLSQKLKLRRENKRNSDENEAVTTIVNK